MGDKCRVCGTYHDYPATVCARDVEIDKLKARIAELEGELSEPHPYQQVCADCIAMLGAAGFGKPGTPNTLFDMTKQATEEVTRLRTALKKYGRHLSKGATAQCAKWKRRPAPDNRWHVDRLEFCTCGYSDAIREEGSAGPPTGASR